ncbi:MAG: sugar phosphate nucleotidyltransferase [Wenzhouxiangellaceae bacterium]
MKRGIAGGSMPNPHRLGEQTAAVVLAGGKGTRLGALTRHECKPALPFGGWYRNIDFSLSNCVNSGIRRIGVATQYKDGSLIRHIDRVWRPSAANDAGFIELWRAEAMAAAGYRGTADAIFQNWARIDALHARWVLVLAGDHVYKMDYRPMLERHLTSGADVTVGCVEVPLGEASQFGVMSIDAEDRIVRFAEKPRHPEGLPGRPDRALGSMGIYLFDRDWLGQRLAEDARTETSSHDFGHDLIPSLIDTANVFAYPFTDQATVGGGYWRDVGTVSAYWRTHMELLDGIPGFRLDDANWPLRPAGISLRDASHHSSHAARPARIVDSLIAGGCQLDSATVQRSVLFANSTVEPNAVLSNAVILPNAVIGRDCRLTDVIVEAGVRVPPGTVIEPANRHAGACAPTLITEETHFAGNASDRQRQPYPRPAASRYEELQRTGT